MILSVWLVCGLLSFISMEWYYRRWGWEVRLSLLPILILLGPIGLIGVWWANYTCGFNFPKEANVSDENQTDLDEPNEVENTDDSYISLNVEKTSTNDQAGLPNVKECISITISGTDPVKVAQAARKALEAWEGK